MPKYRKKPVEIEARQLTDAIASNREIAEWCGAESWTFDSTTLHIKTLEGIMKASPGDFIIKGVQGEFYPCKPDIFEQTYELVSTQGETTEGAITKGSEQ